MMYLQGAVHRIPRIRCQGAFRGHIRWSVHGLPMTRVMHNLGVGLCMAGLHRLLHSRLWRFPWSTITWSMNGFATDAMDSPIS